jgi:hypothetical protein
MMRLLTPMMATLRIWFADMVVEIGFSSLGLREGAEVQRAVI